MEQEARTVGDVELTITVEKILELAKEVAKTTVNEINELEEKKRKEKFIVHKKQLKKCFRTIED